MSAIPGSEIARLVLGYLQEQKLDKAYHEFCKSSPYLCEEYALLKRGYKPQQITNFSLMDLVREYSEAREIMNCVIQKQAQICDSDEVSKLFELRSLKEKIQYISRAKPLNADQSFTKNTTNQKRRRKSSPAGTDDEKTVQISPETSQEKSLPGPSHPSKRRRLLHNNIIISKATDKPELFDFWSSDDSDENTAADNSFTNQSNSRTSLGQSDVKKTGECTPSKTDVIPSTSGTKPMSAIKQNSLLNKDPSHQFEIISDAILENRGFQNLLAQNINTGIATTNYNSENIATDTNVSLHELLNPAMESIITDTEKDPKFNDIVEAAIQNMLEAFESEDLEALSPTTDKRPVNDEEPVHGSQMENAVPTETIKQRLRPRKSIVANPPAESPKRNTKRKRGKTIEVISNEPYKGALPECVVPTQENQQSALITSSGTIYLNVPSSVQMPYILTSSEPTAGADGQHSQHIPIVFNPSLCVPSLVNTTANQYILQSISDQNVCQFVPYRDGQRVLDGTENNIILVNADGELTANEINLIPNTTENVAYQNAAVETVVSSTDVGAAILASIRKTNTPKQPVQQTVPISKGLSTPRSKSSHIRILDFTTPLRHKKGATENKSIQTSNYVDETPQNRSIMSTAPNSAPPKINFVQEGVTSSIQPLSTVTEKSSSTDMVHFGRENDEETVISVGSDTPKPRKKNRNSCVRALSSHKKPNVGEEKFEERQKRLANTKKKIENDDESNSNPSTAENQETKTEIATTSLQQTTDAWLNEWKKIYANRRNSNALEQQLREANSKQQELQEPQKNQRRNRHRHRARDKLSKINEKRDDAINSSAEIGDNASPGLSLQAQMLEDALKSAKKETPVKQNVKNKAHQKTPARRSSTKLIIKLPKPSPKTKKRSKENKTLVQKPVDEALPLIEHVADEKEKPDANVTNNLVVDSYQKPIIPIQSDRTPLQLEVAQNLLKLQEGNHCSLVIKRISLNTEENATSGREQKTEIQQSTFTAGECFTSVSTTYSTMMESNVNKIVTTNSHHQGHFSISSLLETPLKLNVSSAFPKTPGIHLPPQLETPLIKYTNFDKMELSLMKNTEFPTPSFPITPGCIITPFKDIISPRSDQETGFGSSNRATDYSSGSSYYKPDESDGVDRQLQSLLKAANRNRSNSQQSCDEVDSENYQYNPSYSQDVHEEQQQVIVSAVPENELRDKGGDDSKLNSSSSSTSSSSSSSDSSSSPETSNVTETLHIAHPQLPSTQVDAHQPLPNRCETNDIVSAIKDHLHSIPASKSTLLLPNQELIDKQTEQAEKQAKLEEKRLRVKNSLKQTETKKVGRSARSSEMSKKARIEAEARIEPLRGPPINQSLSKRNLRKIVPTTNKSTKSTLRPGSSGRPIILMDAKPQIKAPQKKRNIETEKVITEAAGNSAIIDTFRSKRIVSQADKQKPKTTTAPEESVEVIQKHINEPKCSPSPVKNRQFSSSPNSEKLNLIKILEDSDNDNKAAQISKKAEAVNLVTTTTTANISKPENLVSTSKTEDTLKPAIKQTKQEKQTNKKHDRLKERLRETEKQKQVVKKKKSTDRNVTKARPSTSNSFPSAPLSPTSTKADDFAQTPYKSGRSDQIRELFGNISDNFETPIKSPATKTFPESSTPIEIKPVNVSDTETPPLEQKTVEECVRAALDADYDSSDEDSDDEVNLEICTIDETSKDNYHTVVSVATSRNTNPMDKKRCFGRFNICVKDQKVGLTVSDEIELYKGDALYSKRAENQFKKNKKIRAVLQTEADTNVSTTTHSSKKTNMEVKRNQRANSLVPSTYNTHVSRPKIKIIHKDPVVVSTTVNSTNTLTAKPVYVESGKTSNNIRPNKEIFKDNESNISQFNINHVLDKIHSSDK